MNTKRQKNNERWAVICEGIGGKNSEGARALRSSNRRTEKRKRAQFRSAKP